MNQPTPVRRSDAFFGMHFDLHPGAKDTELGADVSADNIAELLKRVRPDYVQYDCKGHPGYTGYPTTIGWASPGIVNDALAVWRQVTREHGVALCIHYSGVIDRVAVEKHPEWAARDAEGNPCKNGAASTFGPYVDELMIPQLIDVCRRYQLDAVWADGECWGAELDWSSWAVDAWTKQTGHPETPKSPEDPHWQQWKDFHRAQFERYLTHWVEAVHEALPGVELCSNWAYSSFVPKRVDAPVDFLSGDFSAVRSVDTARLEARYLSNTGKPWDLMAWGFVWSPDGKIPINLKTPVHLMQEAASVLMLGGGFQVYYGPTRRGYVIEQIIATTEEVARFCRARQAVSHRSTPVPQVAVLVSETTFRRRSQTTWRPWAGEMDAVQGVLRALLESHYSVDLVGEWQVSGKLGQWPVLVLPDVSALEEPFRLELIEYVRQGGQLVLLGAESAGLFPELVGAPVADPVQQSAYLPHGREVALVNGAWADLKPTTAEVILDRFATRDTRPGAKGQAPAAVLNRIDRGAVLTVPGAVATAFGKTHYPALRQVLGGLVARVFPRPIVEVDAPPCVEVSVRRSAVGSLTVHLANFANLPRWDDAPIIDYVPQVGPITLRVRTAVPREVLLHPDNQPLEWVEREGRIELTLPRLHIHAVVEFVER